MKQQRERWIERVRESLAEYRETVPADGWQRLERALRPTAAPYRKPVLSWRRIAAAAVIALALAGTVDRGFDVGSPVVDGNRPVAALKERPEVESVPKEADEGPMEGGSGRDMAVGSSGSLSVRVADAVRRSVGGASDGMFADEAVLLAAGTTDETEHGSEGAMEYAVGAATSGLPPGDKSVETVEEAEASDAIGRDRTGSDGIGSNSIRAAARTFGEVRRGAVSDRLAADPFSVRRAGRISIGLHAGGFPGAGGGTDGPRLYEMFAVADLQRGHLDYTDYGYRHRQPLSFGISVRKELSRRLSVESGVVYSLLISDVRMGGCDAEFDQTLHMIGIPLRMNVVLLRTGSLSLYAGAGVMAERCVYARFGSNSVSEGGLQWSILGALGVQYDLGRHTGIYFEPGLSYYATQTTLRTAHTESPVDLSLQLGFRLTY